MDLKYIEQQARFYATRAAQQVADEAFKYPPADRAAFAGTAASMIFQNLSIALAIDNFPPGSSGGEAFLREIYANALKDAVQRWHKADLKERFGGK